MHGSREYNSWIAMKARCYNPNYHHYHRYGGRGIEVCMRWLESFTAFFEDMGKCPPGCSLDRINNDGNYDADNCRWTTSAAQANNRSPRSSITIEGVTMAVSAWARIVGISPGNFQNRINRGWTGARLLLPRQREGRPSRARR
jgi:hypothetical protein